MTSETGGRRPEQLRVDDEHLWLPRHTKRGTTYDVLVNGRHVWSVQPAERVAWPSAMRRYLKGRAAIEVREHVSGTVVGRAEHAFAGNTEREVSITDAHGNDLVLDKWGRMTRPLSTEAGDALEELLDHVDRLLDDLRTKAGVPAFICYGTLLGAVRNGKLIGHDNDVDVAYVSEHPHPVDVVREGFAVERALRESGWEVRRGSGVRLNVRITMSDGTMRFIDVFTAHWVEGVLFIPSDTGFRLPRETILPLGTVELHGRTMPAPADPERLLAATYGESWRVPDPSFVYTTPRWLSRRLGGWFGGLATHRKHWDTFNATARKVVPREPSPFARWVARKYPSDRPLVDLGTGTGRDARYFAEKHGRPVLALDYSTGAVRRGSRMAARRGIPVSFELFNAYDTRAVLALGAKLARDEPPVDLYVRFTLHDLDHPGRENVYRLASMALRRGGLLFLEFRTSQDRGRPHTFGEHTRRYLKPAAVVRQIEAAGGRVVHRREGTGLAPLRAEDPHMCRIVATWSDAR